MFASHRFRDAASGHTMITHVRSTIASTTFGTSITLSQPAGIQAGDVGILMRTHGSPAGWTAFAANIGAIAWYPYVGGEGSLTFTTGSATQMLAVLSVFRGVDNTSPIDAQSAVRTTTNTTAPLSNAVTAAHDRGMWVSACRAYVTSGTPALTQPSGMILSRQGSPQTVAFGIAYQPSSPVAGGATAAPSWASSISSYDSAVLQLLLRPNNT